MSATKKKLFLKAIAKEKNLLPEDILVALIPHDFIYAHVEHVTLTSPMVSMRFAITGIPIPEMYLQIILAKGAWTGDQMEMRFFNTKSGVYETEQAEFSQEVSISLNDLFVYKRDFADLEKQIPNIFAELTKTEKPLSPKVEESLQTLIGVFLDMLVDKKEKNILPAPGGGNHIFKSQADLIGHIEDYEVRGLGETSLENIFGKANSAFSSKMRD